MTLQYSRLGHGSAYHNEKLIQMNMCPGTLGFPPIRHFVLLTKQLLSQDSQNNDLMTVTFNYLNSCLQQLGRNKCLI